MPTDDTGFGLRFVVTAEPRVGLNQVHLHLRSAEPQDQGRTVQRALDLGARHLDVGQLPEEDHVVLADPDGNEFCVIEAGNGWLAGCGFLGEVACDGTPEVGHFWAAALDWPLVWEQDGETAIRSPHGGPKIAWGGPPLNERHGPNRMLFDLVPPATSRGGRPAGLARRDRGRAGRGRRGAGRPRRQRVPAVPPLTGPSAPERAQQRQFAGRSASPRGADGVQPSNCLRCAHS